MRGKRSKAASVVVVGSVSWRPSLGDPVVATIDKETFTGIVKKELATKNSAYQVNYDGGGKGNVPLTALKPRCTVSGCENGYTPGQPDQMCDQCVRELKELDDTEEAPPAPTSKGGKEQTGFNQYGISWKSENTYFILDMKNEDKGIHFYGFVRKARTQTHKEFYAIDIWAVRAKEEFSVDSITYHEDPRLDMKSLNADICAAANRWFFQRIGGSAQTIDDLLKKAAKPLIRVNRLGTLDAMILKLREFRDTAIRCGGTRTLELRGDREGDTPLLIEINVSVQAYALEGKPPALGTGHVFDGLENQQRGKPLVRAAAQSVQPDQGNVDSLLTQLKNTDDKSQQRKIRSILRKMGHKGGSRAK